MRSGQRCSIAELGRKIRQKKNHMTTTNSPSNRTGLLFVDPYNDFLSEGGKLWPLLKEIAEEEHLLDHLRQIVAAARAAKIQLFIVPHHRWELGDYSKWRHPNPSQIASGKRQTFAKEPGAVNGIRTSCPRKATLSSRSIGPRAVLPTPISINSSNSMASKTSS